MRQYFLDSVGKGEKLTLTTFSLSDDTTIKHSAKVLWRIIEDYADQVKELSWPPTVES